MGGEFVDRVGMSFRITAPIGKMKTVARAAMFLPSRTTGQPVTVQGPITVRPAAINALESRDATTKSREAAIAAI